jgi:hypothetical protein
MKSFIALCFCCIIVFSCNNTPPEKNKRRKVDRFFGNAISDEERIIQITNAKYNKILIPGKWKIINLKRRDAAGLKLSDIELQEIPLDAYKFSLNNEYTIYKGKKILEKGTFEWMAQGREVVMTADDDTTVSRFLIWDINDEFMKVSSKSLFMTFRRLHLVRKASETPVSKL